MPSKETIKRALFRSLYAGIMGALGSFVMIPVNLGDPRKYLLAVGIGMATGFLMGLVKFIKGYVQYDK